ncbi:hypothetical protein IAR55_001027 [Kwoniella newhampshirensis]|uniref:Uncharacterized protein n=1 Tax=Kwoniella newhampshirensis TaxID=1651941 RepID=A0AAW0Z4J1_9TREE
MKASLVHTMNCGFAVDGGVGDGEGDIVERDVGGGRESKDEEILVMHVGPGDFVEDPALDDIDDRNAARDLANHTLSPITVSHI